MTSQRLRVSIVALSIQAAALAPDLQAAGPRLQLDSPILRLAQHAELSSVCRSSAHIYACTDFPEESLRADCVKADRGWSIDATARISPVMYLSKPRWVQHELIHLNHLERMVGQYLDHLATIEFESESSCRESAAEAENHFRVRMNGFRKISNLTYR
jgi:hypothetical protein